MDRLEVAARHYGSVLSQLKLPCAIIHVQVGQDGPAPISMTVDGTRPGSKRKAIAALQARPTLDHAGHAVHDLMMDLANTACLAAGVASGQIGVVAITSAGHLYVDCLATGKRLIGESGPAAPKPFGRLLAAAPDVIVPNYEAMAEAFADIGLEWIVVEVTTGEVSFHRSENPVVDEDDARGVVHTYADVLTKFMEEAMLNARLACSMGVAPYDPDACEVRHNVSSGLAFIGPKDGSASFVKVAAMSTALDPSGLTPSAALWAQAAYDAIAQRDEDRLREAATAFALANGGDATEIARYAYGIAQRDDRAEH